MYYRDRGKIEERKEIKKWEKKKELLVLTETASKR